MGSTRTMALMLLMLGCAAAAAGRDYRRSSRNPKACSEPSCVPTYTCPIALQKLPGDANDVIAFALFQSAFPVTPSYACSTAGAPCPVADAGRPVDKVNTTPLTTIGVAGAVRSCEVHAGVSENAAPPENFNATTPPDAMLPFVDDVAATRPLTGTRIHRAPRTTVGGVGGVPGGASDGRGGAGVIVISCHDASAPAIEPPVATTVLDA